MKRSDTRQRTRRLALCSVFCALGVVLLYFGAILEVLDLSLAMIASILVIFCVIEFGGFWPWLVYFVTSLLSFLLLPAKTSAIAYAVLFGFYPILKGYIEKSRLPALLKWMIKIAVFAASEGLYWGVSTLFLVDLDFGVSLPVIGAIVLVAMVVYDVALTLSIRVYLHRYRKHFRFLK